MFGIKKEIRKDETLIKSRVRIRTKIKLKQKRNRSINTPEMNQKQEIKEKKNQLWFRRGVRNGKKSEVEPEIGKKRDVTLK